MRRGTLSHQPAARLRNLTSLATHFADLRLEAGDPGGTARIVAYRPNGSGRSAGLIAVAAFDRLGDTARARELARTFMGAPEAGGGVDQAGQAVRYRETALRILGGPRSTPSSRRGLPGLPRPDLPRPPSWARRSRRRSSRVAVRPVGVNASSEPSLGSSNVTVPESTVTADLTGWPVS